MKRLLIGVVLAVLAFSAFAGGCPGGNCPTSQNQDDDNGYYGDGN